MKRAVVLMILAIAMAISAFSAKKLYAKAQKRVDSEPVSVKPNLYIDLVEPGRGEMRLVEKIFGEVKSRREISISTNLSGYISKVLVKETDSVDRGTPLVEIDSKEFESTLGSLKKRYRTAVADRDFAVGIYERNMKLYRIGGISKEALEASRVAKYAKETVVTDIYEQIVRTKHKMEYLKISAPISGKIDRILLHRGDLAAPGKSIMILHDERKDIEFTYPPKEGDSIQIGDPVYVDGRKVGSVRVIYEKARNGLNVARASLEGDLHIPVGGYLRADVEIGRVEGCILPMDTILHRNGSSFVMSYIDGRFEPLRIEAVENNDSAVVVRECPKYPLASGSEAELALLPAGNRKVIVRGSGDGK
jgi:biotin carboxyl carrier protein